MVVTATIAPKCSLIVNNLDFGDYNLIDAPGKDSSTTLLVKCSVNAPYTITANGGSHGTIKSRGMSNGKDTLLYNLYTDPGRATIFGDGTNNSVPITGTGQGVNIENTHTVYGRIPTAQDLSPGNYQDVVTVTITF